MQTTKSAVSNHIPLEQEIDATLENDIQNQRRFIGIKRVFISVLIRIQVIKLVFRNFKNPREGIKVFKALIELKSNILGGRKFKKIANVDGKYMWDLYTPAWPSITFDNFIEGEINRISSLQKRTNRFTNVFVAITKKCALKCEHCFEWDALNGKEKLSTDDLKTIVSKLQIKGVGQIQFSGGEPLLRVRDIITAIKEAHSTTDFWVISSGQNLTFKNAELLKQAGLTGVEISLDHFEREKHNKFRGHVKSFDWAKEAISNAIKNNLVAAISICVTRSFVSEKNLMSYMELALAWGVSFVQILEPKAVGHYKNKDVGLNHENIQTLENFYLKMNYDKRYKDFPIVTYHGYHQRRVGCFSSANRNLYIDTDGDIHACPFCQTKRGSVLSDNFENSIEKLTTFGCQSFNKSIV